MDLLRSLQRDVAPAFEAATSAYEALPSYETAKVSLGLAVEPVAVTARALGTVMFFVLIVVALVLIVRVFGPNAGLDSTKQSAYARHILVEHEETALQLKQEMAHKEGMALLTEFHAKAALHSRCSSGAVGGALGCLGPGKMAPAFDSVVWSAPLMALQGPVQTDSGFHLILVIQRSSPSGETKKDC